MHVEFMTTNPVRAKTEPASTAASEELSSEQSALLSDGENLLDFSQGATRYRSFEESQPPAETRGSDVLRDTFPAKAMAHWEEMGRPFTGWFGNLTGIIPTSKRESMENGCVGWSLWMQSAKSGLPNIPGIKLTPHHFMTDSGFNHEVVVASFPEEGGKKFVLDPWRIPKSPIHDFDAYVSKHVWSMPWSPIAGYREVFGARPGMISGMLGD